MLYNNHIRTKYQYRPSLVYSMFYEICVAIIKITASNVHEILHVVITTVDCVDMYKSFITLYKPTIKYFMSYYKYTLEESTELVLIQLSTVRLFGEVLLSWQKP